MHVPELVRLLYRLLSRGRRIEEMQPPFRFGVFGGQHEGRLHGRLETTDYSMGNRRESPTIVMVIKLKKLNICRGNLVSAAIRSTKINRVVSRNTRFLLVYFAILYESCTCSLSFYLNFYNELSHTRVITCIYFQFCRIPELVNG